MMYILELCNRLNNGYLDHPNLSITNLMYRWYQASGPRQAPISGRILQVLEFELEFELHRSTSAPTRPAALDKTHSDPQLTLPPLSPYALSSA